jgi:glycosyltransferase involved in cell wall biosynthesis
MKVLLINSSDLEGGAARAAYRLHQGLQTIGVSSEMLVQTKLSRDKTVLGPRTRLEQGIAKARLTFDALPLKLYTQRDRAAFSMQWLMETVPAQLATIAPDLVNLHWINDAYVQIESLAKLNRPIVWTLHDMWAFTGGCHYSFACDRYQTACGNCPHLHSQYQWDLSHWNWQRKARAWKHTPITIVALCQWMAASARSSSLFKHSRIETIPNGLNTQLYRPIHRQTARELLHLPLDKQLVLFGAVSATDDPRKGFQLLQPALQSLCGAGWRDRLELVVFGATQPADPPEFGTRVHYLGSFSDDLSLALVYSAADVFVLPSTQENLANTVMEAIACGTPCVTFKIGGLPDMVEHQMNGYLAQPYDVEDLAQGIAWVLQDRDRYQNLSQRARQKAEQEFTQELQARRYQALFAELLDNARQPLLADQQSPWGAEVKP